MSFFLSFKTINFIEADKDDYAKKYAKELDTPEKRFTFAEKLRAALHPDNYTNSTDSSYAVDISISGSQTGDEGIRYVQSIKVNFVYSGDVVCF